MGSVGQELYDNGWRQGSLLHAHLAHQSHVDLNGSVEAHSPIDQWVISEQDCDIIKPDDTFPDLEAIACRRLGVDTARAILSNDSRYFVVNAAEGLVADRTETVHVSKQSLVDSVPSAPPFDGDDSRGRTFARWLGQRYTRAAIPDPVVSLVARPLAQAFRDLCRPGKRLHWLSDQLHEVRYLSRRTSDRLDIDLVFLIRHTSDEEMAAGAVAEVIARAGLPLAPFEDPADAPQVVVSSWVVVPTAKISVLRYADMTPLPLEFMSYEGSDSAYPLEGDPPA